MLTFDGVTKLSSRCELIGFRRVLTPTFPKFATGARTYCFIGAVATEFGVSATPGRAGRGKALRRPGSPYPVTARRPFGDAEIPMGNFPGQPCIDGGGLSSMVAARHRQILCAVGSPEAADARRDQGRPRVGHLADRDLDQGRAAPLQRGVELAAQARRGSSCAPRRCRSSRPSSGSSGSADRWRSAGCRNPSSACGGHCRRRRRRRRSRRRRCRDSAAVDSSCTLYINPPSPETDTTGTSGRADLGAERGRVANSRACPDSRCGYRCAAR